MANDYNGDWNVCNFNSRSGSNTFLAGADPLPDGGLTTALYQTVSIPPGATRVRGSAWLYRRNNFNARGRLQLRILDSAGSTLAQAGYPSPTTWMGSGHTTPAGTFVQRTLEVDVPVGGARARLSFEHQNNHAGWACEMWDDAEVRGMTPTTTSTTSTSTSTTMVGSTSTTSSSTTTTTTTSSSASTSSSSSSAASTSSTSAASTSTITSATSSVLQLSTSAAASDTSTDSANGGSEAFLVVPIVVTIGLCILCGGLVVAVVVFLRRHQGSKLEVELQSVSGDDDTSTYGPLSSVAATNDGHSVGEYHNVSPASRGYGSVNIPSPTNEEEGTIETYGAMPSVAVKGTQMGEDTSNLARGLSEEPYHNVRVQKNAGRKEYSDGRKVGKGVDTDEIYNNEPVEAVTDVYGELIYEDGEYNTVAGRT